jgi:predicted RNA-binding protein with PIN domain
MALARIMVDGYSLLHSWPELAPGKARHSAAARDELARVLRLYADTIHTPVTIVFDGNSAKGAPQTESDSALEIVYSHSGQTADDVIERVTHRMRPYGEVMAVTDDHAERDTVISLGGSACGCLNFIQMIENSVGEMERSIKHHNQRERARFNRPQ